MAAKKKFGLCVSDPSWSVSKGHVARDRFEKPLDLTRGSSLRATAHNETYLFNRSHHVSVLLGIEKEKGS
jgi:hypothetical protein